MEHTLKTISATLIRLAIKKGNYTFKDLSIINIEVEATIRELQRELNRQKKFGIVTPLVLIKDVVG